MQQFNFNFKKDGADWREMFVVDEKRDIELRDLFDFFRRKLKKNEGFELSDFADTMLHFAKSTQEVAWISFLIGQVKMEMQCKQSDREGSFSNFINGLMEMAGTKTDTDLQNSFVCRINEKFAGRGVHAEIDEHTQGIRIERKKDGIIEHQATHEEVDDFIKKISKEHGVHALSL
jgi:hypothetical protein